MIKISQQYYDNKKRKIKNISDSKQYIRTPDESHMAHKKTTTQKLTKIAQTTVEKQQKHHKTTESITKGTKEQSNPINITVTIVTWLRAINRKKDTGKCTKANQRHPDDNPSAIQQQYKRNTAATHRQRTRRNRQSSQNKNRVLSLFHHPRTAATNK